MNRDLNHLKTKNVVSGKSPRKSFLTKAKTGAETDFWHFFKNFSKKVSFFSKKRLHFSQEGVFYVTVDSDERRGQQKLKWR